MLKRFCKWFDKQTDNPVIMVLIGAILFILIASPIAVYTHTIHSVYIVNMTSQQKCLLCSSNPPLGNLLEIGKVTRSCNTDITYTDVSYNIKLLDIDDLHRWLDENGIKYQKNLPVERMCCPECNP